MSKLALGVVGASSMIAKELVEWMSKWRVANADVHFYDTKEHIGYIQCCCDHFMPIQEASDDAIKNLDLVIFCDEKLHQQYADKCKETSYQINLCSYVEHEKIMIPHLNSTQLQRDDHALFIANASLFMLTSILDIACKQEEVEEVNVTTLASVAECGYDACHDLSDQLHAYEHKQDLESKIFPMPNSFQHLPLLFQVLPQTAPFLRNGQTQEEAFLKQKLSLFCEHVGALHVTCARIASMRGLAMDITIKMKDDIDLDRLVDGFASSPSCICIDDIAHDMYPICGDVIHDYRIYIGRIRKSESSVFQAWSVCDDLSIRCAAAMQIVLYITHNFLNE